VRAGEGGDVIGVVAEHRLDLGELPAEHGGDGVELLGDVCTGPGWAKMVRIAPGGRRGDGTGNRGVRLVPAAGRADAQPSVSSGAATRPDCRQQALLGLRNERPLGGQRDHKTALPQLLDGPPGGAHSDLILGGKVALTWKPGTSTQLTRIDPGRDVIRHRGIDIRRADGLWIEPRHLRHKITIGRPRAAQTSRTRHTAL
jgi:hypothetical protein